MSYPSAGDFFLAPIPGWGGKGIRFGEMLNGQGFLKVQHAGIYLGQGMTVEAYPGGAIQGEIERFQADSLVWSTDLVELTPVQRLGICSAALKYQGVPYSFLDYAAIAAHRFHLPIPHLKKYVADTGHMICSQLVDQAYLDADVHLFDDGRWPGFVDPGSLWHLLDEIRSHNIGMGI